jgi:REase_MTES_1575/Protein of unknown function (DUF3320)
VKEIESELNLSALGTQVAAQLVSSSLVSVDQAKNTQTARAEILPSQSLPPRSEINLRNVLRVGSSEERMLKTLQNEEHTEIVNISNKEKKSLVVNLISNALSQRQKVLYVAKDEKNYHELAEELRIAGLYDVVLSLSEKTAPAEVTEKLRQTLGLGPVTETTFDKPDQFIKNLENRLSDYLKMLKAPIGESGVSGYEALSWLIANNHKLPYEIEFDTKQLQPWSKARFEQALDVAQEFEAFIHRNGVPSDNPWRGSAFLPRTEQDKKEIQSLVENCHEAAQALQIEVSNVLGGLGIDVNMSEEQFIKTLEALLVIDRLETQEGELLKGVNLRSPQQWLKEKEFIQDALETQLRVTELAGLLGGKVDFNKLRSLDLNFVHKVITDYIGKNAISKLFDDEYKKAISRIGRVANLPKKPEDVLKLVGHLSTLQELIQRCDSYKKSLLGKFFGLGEEDSDKTFDRSFWRKTSQVGFSILSIISYCEANPASRIILGLLRKPTELYNYSVQLEGLHSLYVNYKNTRTAVFAKLRISNHNQEELFTSCNFTAQEKRLFAMRHGFEHLAAWQDFNKLSEKARNAGFDFIANKALEAKDPQTQILQGLRRAWHSGLTREAIYSNPLGVNFSTERIETVYERLIEAEEKHREQTLHKILQAHWTDLPRYNVGGQSGILCEEIEKNSDWRPIKEFFSLAGKALQQTCPVILTTEKGLEAHLSGANIDVDLLVLDEQAPLEVRSKRIVALNPINNEENRGNSTFIDAQNMVKNEEETKKVAALDLFQIHLKSLLEEKLGLRVHSNIKTEKYCVDLAVIDSKQQETYALGIQIDGLNYQSIPSALESDRLRRFNPQTAGLPIIREWIVDWAKNPKAQADAFLNSVQASLRNNKVRRDSDNLLIYGFKREALQEHHLQLIKPYQKITPDLSKLVSDLRFGKEPKISDLAKALVQIVNEEGPLHRDEVTQRFIESTGRRRLSYNLHLQLVEAEQLAIKQKKLLVRGDFMHYASPDQKIAPRARGHLKGTAARFERIPEEELQAGICQIVKRSYGISRNEIVDQVVRLFGYKGMPFGADAIVERELAELIERKVICENNAQLEIGDASLVS